MTLSFALVSACSSAEPAEPKPAAAKWALVEQDLDTALISVWGTSETDVWAVGGDKGSGPIVLHSAADGSGFERLATGSSGDLWWAFGFADGPVFFGGEHGTILRYEAGVFTPMSTPSQSVTVFGIWGATPDSLWAVGGSDGGGDGAFAWRLDGEKWVDAPEFPADLAVGHALWKVWGSAENDVWLVGTAGMALHYDGSTFEDENVGGGESLFTVHYGGGRYVAVGGGGTGLVFENDGTGFQQVDAGDLSGLVGVHVVDEKHAYAVGRFGAFVEEQQGRWVETAENVGTQTLHSIWADPAGGLWTVGGELDVRPTARGVLAYRGPHPPNGTIQ